MALKTKIFDEAKHLTSPEMIGALDGTVGKPVPAKWTPPLASSCRAPPA